MLSAIILSIPWLINETGILLLFAWIPLLYAEKQLALSQKSFKIWIVGYLCFFFWNLLTTWWLYSVSEELSTKLFASVVPIICNALLMSIAWILFHHTRKKLGNSIGYFSLICYWISFEYIHLNWDLSWPWLTLGNGFANSIYFIQWYEYTGTLGGSLWVLVSNILLFRLFENIFNIGGLKGSSKNCHLLHPLLWRGKGEVLKNTIFRTAIKVHFIPSFFSLTILQLLHKVPWH